MAAGVVITIATGGSGGLVLIEGAGAVISSAAEYQMSQAADEFLTRANKCKNATCAEKTIKDELKRMANLQSHFEDAEIKAIDQEFARLVDLLPDDAAVYNTMLANNELPWHHSDSWETEQVWNAVGAGLQMYSVIKSLWGATASRLTNTTAKLKAAIKRAKARWGRTHGTAPGAKPGVGAHATANSSRATGDSANKVLANSPDADSVAYAEEIDPSVIKDVLVRAIYEWAFANEREITRDLMEIVDENGGKLHGLEYRMTLLKIRMQRLMI